jgi:hypothetical protein
LEAIVAATKVEATTFFTSAKAFFGGLTLDLDSVVVVDVLVGVVVLVCCYSTCLIRCLLVSSMQYKTTQNKTQKGHSIETAKQELTRSIGTGRTAKGSN